MPAYNAGEIDEEETRSRNSRAQGIEGRREDGDNPMEGEGERSGISNPPRLADWKCRTEGKREKGNGRKGEREKGDRK